MATVKRQAGGPASEMEASDRRLRRELSFTQLLFLSLGSIIGSGWLFATLAADSIAGPAVILSWLIGGALILLIALTYAEVSGMLPRTGAVIRYPHLTHGGYTGFILSWAFLVSVVTTPAIEAEAVVQYAATYIGGLTRTGTANGQQVTLLTGFGIAIGVALMALFFAVNYLGVRFLGRFNQVFTWWKLVVPVLTFAFLFVVFDSSNYTAFGGFFAQGVPSIFLAISTSGIVFSYLGFRQALDYGGEARNPQRDIPLATILSVLIAVVIYSGLQIAFTGAIDWGSMSVKPGAWDKLSAAAWADSPLYHALRASGLAALGAFSYVLLADAFVSPTATGWVYMGAASRIGYGMGLHGDLPRFFSRIHDRFRIPWMALAASAVVGCIFFLPLPSWYLFVGFVTSATVLTFMMGGVQLTVMRRTAPGLERPFRLPAAGLMAPLGFLAAVMVFYWAGFETLRYVVPVAFFGMPLFAWVHGPRHGFFSGRTGAPVGLVYLVAFAITQYYGPISADSLPIGAYFALVAAEIALFTAAVWQLSDGEGRRTIASGVWLLFTILSLFVLSYYGTYGERETSAVPYDNLVALGIGLVGFYWGVASGYRTEAMREICDNGSALAAWEEDAETAAPEAREARTPAHV